MTTLEKSRTTLTAAEMEARIVRYGDLEPRKTAEYRVRLRLGQTIE